MKSKRFSASFLGTLNPTNNTCFSFTEAHFYGKYGYSYFDTELNASHARQVLRAETNLVVSFAKSAPRPVSSTDLSASPSEESQAPTPRFSVIMKKVASSGAGSMATAPSSSPPTVNYATELNTTVGAPRSAGNSQPQSKQQSASQPSRQPRHASPKHIKHQPQQQNLHHHKQQPNAPQYDKFDRTPGAGRPFQHRGKHHRFESLPTPSAFSQMRNSPQYPNVLNPSSPSIYGDQNPQKVSQEIFQTLAFGYDWRGGSIGGLVMSPTDKNRQPFSLENFRAGQQRAAAASQEEKEGTMLGRATDSLAAEGNSGGAASSWNPFGFESGVDN